MAPDVIDIRDGTRSQFAASVGMALLLVSWALTFIALFLAYAFIRVRAPEWPPPGSPELPLGIPVGNTIMVLASSVTFHRALQLVRRGRGGVGRWLIAASAGAVGFLALQALSWAQLWSAGFRTGQNSYAGTFYMLTIFHAAHVVFALVSLGALVPRIRRGEMTIREHTPLKLAGWFWHFVSIAWIGTFLTLYAF